MHRDSIEELFEAWRRHRNGGALGEVFDRAAPELYRVAVHLARNVATAEDLVQSTFLAALESPGGWRSGSPLFPWLLGILTNRLRMERRRAHQVVPSGSTRHHTPESPVDAATAAELEATLDRCLAELPESYRTPLALHLRHDLSAAEIAAAIDRPAGTVRSQLSRGLDRLRQLLPPGIGAIAAVGVLSPAAFANVRQIVLARAASLSGVAGGGTLLGGMLAMKKLSVLVVLLMIGVVVFVWSPSGDPTGATETGSPTTARVPSNSESRPPSRAAETDGGVARRVVAAPAANVEVGLRVHVEWHDGEPAGGVLVTAMPTRGELVALHARTRRTDERGTVFFASTPDRSIDVSTQRGGKKTIAIDPEQLTSASIEIPRGIDVAGTVVDADGAPVAGAIVLLGLDPDGQMRSVASSDEAGRFAIRSAGGERWLGARADGYAPCQRLRVEEHAREDVRLRLVQRAEGVIEGLVVDEHGEPVQDALAVLGATTFGMTRSLAKSVRAGKGLPAPLEDLTDAAGRFRICGIQRFHKERLRIGSAGHAIWTRYVEPRPDRPVHVEVRLERGVILRGVARDQEGRPCERVYIHIRTRNSPPPGISDQGPDWSRASTRVDAQGRYRFSHLPSGTLQVQARKSGKNGLVAFREIPGARPGDVVEWNPVLRGGLHIHGTLRSFDGSPIAGWYVGASTPAGAPSPDGVVTAADGGFRLRPCVDVAHALTCRPETGAWRHWTVLRREGILPGDEAVELVVAKKSLPSSFLTGIVVDSENGALTGIQVMAQTRNFAMSSTVVDAGQRFEIGPLPAGTYRIRTTHPDRGTVFVASFELRPNQRLDAGTIRFDKPGKMLLIASDSDDVPVRQAIFLLLSDRGQSSEQLRIQNGKGESGALAPGRYFVKRWGNQLYDKSSFTIRSGETATLRVREVPGQKSVFRFHYGGLDLPVNCKVTWRTKDGEAIGRTSLHLWQPKAFTDIDFYFAAGGYRLELELPSGRVINREFEVSTRLAREPVVVQLNGGR